MNRRKKEAFGIASVVALSSASGSFTQEVGDTETFILEPFQVVSFHLLVTEMADQSNIIPVAIILAADFDKKGFSTTAEALPVTFRHQSCPSFPHLLQTV